MIEKLEQNQIFMPVEIASKINELIEKVNAIELALNEHYHQTPDEEGKFKVGMITSSPRF